jgi:membrane associated rhomboid family serine protease
MPENLRRQRRRSGSPARQAPQDGPSLLFLLLAVNVLVFTLPRLIGGLPAEPGGMLSWEALKAGQWWTVATHVFVHNDALHLVSNMALLWAAGRRVLADAGPRHFLYIYFGSGLAAAVVSMLLHPSSPLLGASGCVTGVVGAYAALHPDRSITAWMGAFFPRLRARSFFFGVLFAEIILEVVSLSTESSLTIPAVHGVAHAAHAAGLLAGWGYAQLLAPVLDTLCLREDFFPQGLRRRRRDSQTPESVQSGCRPNSVPVIPLEFLEGEEDDGEDSAAAGSSRRQSARPAVRSNDEFLREAVDPVLDKLYAHGMNSLTEAEKAILHEAATRFSTSGPKTPRPGPAKR